MHTQHPEVIEMARCAFPAYTGRSFAIQPFAGEMATRSCWDGGSRDYWCLLNLATRKTWHVPENGTPFVNGGKSFKVGRLPANIALAHRRIFRGRDIGITLYLNPANIRADMIPAKPVMEWAESVVLAATRSLKSSYAGIKNYRFHEARSETGITETEWNAAKEACIRKGWLNRAGAITDDGRNVIEWTKLGSLRDGHRDASGCALTTEAVAR